MVKGHLTGCGIDGQPFFCSFLTSQCHFDGVHHFFTSTPYLTAVSVYMHKLAIYKYIEG